MPGQESQTLETRPMEPGGCGATPAFSPDAMVAGRFRIIRFIAKGGMGEVYEAHDTELGIRVALKTISPEIARNERTIARFKREIVMARTVAHPNVCKVYDIGYHRSADGSSQQVAFLTMEFLDGETLLDRIRRAGRMSAADALPLVEQMTAGLSAAHRAGVIHRDFKSPNVMIVAGSPEHPEPRAVITDFGIARSAEGDSGAATTTGIISGTPAYMAPEQVVGGAITPATDIYALGVVIYEMMTGSLPFRGDTPISVAIKRLHEPPASPRVHVGDLDSKWEAAILGCLERRPEDRVASAEDVMRALRGERVDVPGVERRRRRRVLVSTVAVAVAVLVVLGYVALRVPHKPAPIATEQEPSAAAAISKARRSVAVLGFRNLSGRPEAAWLSTALSEMLGNELAAGERLMTIAGEDIARAKTDLSLPEAESYSKDTLNRIRAHLTADIVLLGSYLAPGEESGGRLRLDMRLQDALSGGTIAAVTETGTEAQILDLVSKTGADLRAALGIGELSSPELQAARALQPANPEAARLYAEALDKLRRYEAPAARDLLEKAVKADPGYPLAYVALADAWSLLGYDAKSKEAAKKGYDLSKDLPREELLLVEGRYYQASARWDDAVATYKRLFGYFSDSLEYGLRLADAQIQASKAKDALITLAALRRLPPPLGADPRIDLAETEAHFALSEYKEALTAARAAAQRARAEGSRFVLAKALHDEAGLLRSLSEPVAALRQAELAMKTFEQLGDRSGVGASLNVIACVLNDQGKYAEAMATNDRALAVFKELGHKGWQAYILQNLGVGSLNLGDLSKARRLLEESIALSVETGDQTATAYNLNALANIYRDEGDFDTAGRNYEKSLAIYRETESRSGTAMVLRTYASLLRFRGDCEASLRRAEESLSIYIHIGDEWSAAAAKAAIADTLAAQGRIAQAQQKYEEALKVFRELGSKSRTAWCLWGMGDLACLRGDLDDAAKKQKEALRLYDELDERSSAAWSRRSLASVSLANGRLGDAQESAQAAVDSFRSLGVVDEEARAEAVLARVFIAKGDAAEAQQAIAHARQLVAKSQHVFARVEVAIAAAEVNAASGVLPDARKSAEEAIALASRTGLVPLELTAELALGRIEIASGNAAAGARRLDSVLKRSRDMGIGLIAREAERTLADHQNPQ